MLEMFLTTQISGPPFTQRVAHFTESANNLLGKGVNLDTLEKI